jgi:ABC-type sulfate transport system permease component
MNKNALPGSEHPPKWICVFNAALAAVFGFLMPDMIFSWSVFWVEHRSGSLNELMNSESFAFGSLVVGLALGLLFACLLCKWQWRRSLESNRGHEIFVSFCGIVMCLIAMSRPFRYVEF